MNIHAEVGNCAKCVAKACDGACKPVPAPVAAIAEAYDIPLMEIRTGRTDAPMVTISRLEHLRLLAIEEASNTLLRDRTNLEVHFQDLRGLLKGAKA